MVSRLEEVQDTAYTWISTKCHFTTDNTNKNSHASARFNAARVGVITGDSALTVEAVKS
eukprot:m.5387 g.5387  ORF g.5387 m.5387 type:complete len:59 (+) comp7628_c0_seq1:173-349(+)